VFAGHAERACEPRCLSRHGEQPDVSHDATCRLDDATPAACFVVGSTVTVNNVVVTGNRPLVILADTIQVNGLLDAAAHEAMLTRIAPGAPL